MNTTKSPRQYRTTCPAVPNCPSCDTLLVGPDATPAIVTVYPTTNPKRARQVLACEHCAV